MKSAEQKKWITSLSTLFLFSAIALANRNEAFIYADTTQVKSHYLEEANFYATELGLDSLVSIRIVFTNTMPRGKDGLVHYENLGFGWRPHQVMIWIDQKASPIEKSTSIAHELVHASQFIKGQLVKISNSQFEWKNQKYNVRQFSYLDRPWEREAINLASKLRKKYRSKPKSLTETLDGDNVPIVVLQRELGSPARSEMRMI